MGKKPGGCKMELFHFEKRNENYRKIKKKIFEKNLFNHYFLFYFSDIFSEIAVYGSRKKSSGLMLTQDRVLVFTKAPFGIYILF